MIIPIRCFTCGNVIASKYEKYKYLINKNKECNILSIDQKKKTNNCFKNAMEKVGLKRYCCKRHILGHLSILEDI